MTVREPSGLLPTQWVCIFRGPKSTSKTLGLARQLLLSTSWELANAVEAAECYLISNIDSSGHLSDKIHRRTLQ